jgi:hypothetical protein
MADEQPTLTAAELEDIGERVRENCRGLAVDDRARLYAALVGLRTVAAKSLKANACTKSNRFAGSNWGWSC